MVFFVITGIKQYKHFRGKKGKHLVCNYIKRPIYVFCKVNEIISINILYCL